VTGPTGHEVPLTTADFVERARVLHPDQLGVVDEPGVPGSLGRLTYGEILGRCDGMVAALDRFGIGRGERVAIISPNAAKMLIALYAVTGSGRVLVPINHRLGPGEADYIVEHSGAALLLVDPLLVDRFAGGSAIRRIVMDGDQDAELFAPGAPLQWPAPAEDDAATINYTSGTTAAPKGVVLTHRSHWLNAVTVALALGVAAQDRYLHTLPIFHVNGWGLPLIAAALGIPNVIQREVRGPDVLDRVDAEKITLLCGAAPVASAIEAAADERRARGADVPGAGRTRMVSGGAPTPPAVIERFEATTGWEMIHAYGLTETGPMLTVNRIVPGAAPAAPPQRAEALSSAGEPLLGVRLAIDRDGQVRARTAKAMAGYWRAPGLTDDAFVREWLLTGDGGTLVHGRLTITDRKKDVIVTGGENVSSVEVEAVLHDHPDVVDVAVIGVPHERWGETPKALIVLRKGAEVTPEALIAFCRERLAHFKCPTSIELRDSLARTATGKLQKFRLRAPYWP
jgi:fatty-acyl-CoA synthase